MTLFNCDLSQSGLLLIMDAFMFKSDLLETDINPFNLTLHFEFVQWCILFDELFHLRVDNLL